jgi:hypothetical protein
VCYISNSSHPDLLAQRRSYPERLFNRYDPVTPVRGPFLSALEAKRLVLHVSDPEICHYQVYESYIRIIYQNFAFEKVVGRKTEGRGDNQRNSA